MLSSIQTVTKWLPLDTQLTGVVFKNCEHLRRNALELTRNLNDLLENLKKQQNGKNYHEIDIEDLANTASKLDGLPNKFSHCFNNLNHNDTLIFYEKIKLWKDYLWKIKLKITYLLQEIINEIAYLFIYYGEKILTLTLRISTSYNSLLQLDSIHKLAKDISICSNKCPYLMFPMRKISITKLLQAMAKCRAETCCHKLIDCLLEAYKIYDSQEDDGDDNSSMEIYKALTKNMSPPPLGDNSRSPNKTNNGGSFLSIIELISYEEKNILDLLEITCKSAPIMLGDSIKKCRNSGVTKLSSKAKKKVLSYYEEILWGEVGNCLEHVILWWSSSPLASKPPHSSQHFREWLYQYIPNADVPQGVVTALASLADALGVHVTSTSWDYLFGNALVSSKMSSDSGKLFCAVLQDLVLLCNQCEATTDWIVGAPLEELPLVEQIPVLHRLDHSIHTTRLWTISECKKLANNWNVDVFFMVIHTDIGACLKQLDLLKLADHSVQIEKGNLPEHVHMCSLMREKLVSEVKVNIQKLKEAPKECINILAKVCRTICLANLQMIFPCHSYWKTKGNGVPNKPSDYVEKYLQQILTPILAATNDYNIGNMILQIMCEAWLDHIYINKIKFSHNGALQLLCDFGFVSTWLTNCAIINNNMRKKMLKNEVLRRCEGVGRLLLRCPGEQLKMDGKKKEGDHETMPAEMYVPNQEQWLELRSVKKKGKLFTTSICCGNC